MRATAVQLDNATGNEKTASTTLTAHGDGTYHTTNESWGGGKRVDHPSIGHALMHLAKKHSAGDHFHVHATEDGKTISHQVEEGGRIQGPKEHKTTGQAKKALGAFLDDDGAEGAD